MAKRTHFRLIFRNNLTKVVSVFSDIDTSASRDFYRFAFPQGLEKGEYDYYITADGGTLVLDPNDVRKSTIDGEKMPVYDCGVAMVGKISRGVTTEYKISKTYEQYEG